MKILNFWVLLALFFSIISCSTDDGLTTNDSDTENVDESADSPTLIAIENSNRQTLQSSVIVKVVDEEGNLVEGALVKILDTEVYTENGFAKLFNVFFIRKALNSLALASKGASGAGGNLHLVGSHVSGGNLQAF